MPYCTVCHIEYEEGKKFCRECGGPLAESTSSDTVIGLFCPSCGAIYGAGKKFCKTCGVALLVKAAGQAVHRPAAAGVNQNLTSTAPPLPPDVSLPSRRNLLSYLRKKAGLHKKIIKFKGLIQNLESQKKQISEESIAAALQPYQDQLDIFERQVKEIEAFLGDVQKKLNQEIQGLSREEAPYGKRCAELRVLKKAKGLTFGDYRRLKKDPSRESKRMKKQIRTHQKLLKILKEGGSGQSARSSLFWKTGIVVLAIILFAGGGYLGYRQYSRLEDLKRPEATATASTSIPAAGIKPPLSSEEEIKKVFETVQKAMETQDINLYMSGFSAAFPGFEDKKKQTAKTWEENDLTDIRFTLRDLIIQKDTAEVTVEWSFTSKNKKGSQAEPLTSETGATLQKETGQWKIINLK